MVFCFQKILLESWAISRNIWFVSFPLKKQPVFRPREQTDHIILRHGSYLWLPHIYCLHIHHHHSIGYLSYFPEWTAIHNFHYCPFAQEYLSVKVYFTKLLKYTIIFVKSIHSYCNRLINFTMSEQSIQSWTIRISGLVEDKYSLTISILYLGVSPRPTRPVIFIVTALTSFLLTTSLKSNEGAIKVCMYKNFLQKTRQK